MKFTRVTTTKRHPDRYRDWTIWANEDESCVIIVYGRNPNTRRHRGTLQITIQLTCMLKRVSYKVAATAFMNIRCKIDGVESFIIREIIRLAESCGGDYRATEKCLNIFCAVMCEDVGLTEFQDYKESQK